VRRDEFDPRDIRQEDMNAIADIIEEYLMAFDEIMVIPDSLKTGNCEEKIEESKRRARKFIEKLRKGKRSVFKDEDEWNHIM
jgi:RNase H-fold protein (predicted Holliday junction resolvase)